jgi:hypothetical protein
MRRLVIGPLAASAATAALLIGSATVASASHTVEVGDTGTLVAKGAAVVVPVTVTCQPGTTPFPPFPFPGGPSVSVTLTQRTGNRIAQGFGGAPVVCDGTPQTVNVQLTASQAPFKHGPAAVTASLTQCDPLTFQCHTASDSEEITLTK